MSAYSHRNGETEPPTEDGYYWFSGTVVLGDEELMDNSAVWVMACAAIACLGVFEKCFYRDMNGKWWGPIVPPWEANAR